MKKSLRFGESDMSLEFCLSRGANARYMEKETYDADEDGIVDNAARLGGYLPSEFALEANVPYMDEGGNWFFDGEKTGFKSFPIDVANALVGAANGEGRVLLCDVSPMPHEMLVRSDAASLTVTGKNLFDPNAQNLSTQASVRVAKDEPNKMLLTCLGAGTMQCARLPIDKGEELEGQTLTLQGKWTPGVNADGTRPTGRLVLTWAKADGLYYLPICEITESGTTSSGVVYKKPEEDVTLCLVAYANYNGWAYEGTSTTYEDVQLEVGESASAYAPFQRDTYTAEDGVYRVKSVSPVCSISVADGASICVDEYQKDVNLALAQAGENGLSPYIGENGNWWIGEEDTGVKADAGNALFESSVTTDDWDGDSTGNHSYHFKLFDYPERAEADVETRLTIGARLDLGGNNYYDGTFYYRYAFNLSKPYKHSDEDTNAARITLKPQRVMFENEAYKSLVEYFRVYEKPGDGAKNELWVEIKTSLTADSGYATVKGFDMSVLPKFGEFENVAIEQKGYEPFKAMGGYDSLTVYSADWANKTSNLNLSSRATAPYATASGNDSRAEGEAGDVGGVENVGKGKADFVRGEKNQNEGAASLVTGTSNKNEGANSVVAGTGNTNKSANSVVVGSVNLNNSAHSFLSGTKNLNAGSNAVMVGHTNTNSGDHAFIHGYENHNDGTGKGRCDYVDMHGTQLSASRRLQMLRGQWNENDARAIAIFANGTSSERKNVFTIAADGTPTKDTDGVTKGYLHDTFQPQCVPHIDEETGNWFIGEVDTGVRARGEDGQNGRDGWDGRDGDTGADGLTPYIGENGNWWVGALDMQVTAMGDNMANAIKGSKSVVKGAVLLTDVSPVSHEIEVQTAWGGTLMVTGKNLFDHTNTNFSTTASAHPNTLEGKNTILTVECNVAGTMQHAIIPIPDGERLVGQTVTLSSGKWDPLKNEDGTLPRGRIALAWAKSSGSHYVTICEMLDAGETSTGVVTDKPADAVGLCLLVYANYDTNGKVGSLITYYNIQLELGSSASEFELYKNMTTYDLGANNEGRYRVKSISPSTSILSNKGLNVIVKNYHRDVNKVLENIGDTLTDAQLDSIVARVLAAMSGSATTQIGEVSE